MVVHTPKQTISITSGSGMSTFILCSGELKHIVLEPATTTTTFDWEIISSDNVVLTEGSKNNNSDERYAEEFGIPMRGNFTVSITNCSADEDIICKPSFIENYGN